MAHVIIKRRVEPDSWKRLDAGASPDALGQSGDLIVPLTLWTGSRDRVAARDGRTGVWLAPGQDADALSKDLHALPLVAVEFPKLADGRGHSTGWLLRKRLGYRGELRAFGDLIRDSLLLLERCGFDTFELREGEDPARALAAFTELPATYQASATDPLPAFRRHGPARVLNVAMEAA
jgi:uncharacterized protein (DUF934 family)